jgi:hypothetical protein
VASNRATTFDIKNQTTKDFPTLKAEGSTVWDDLYSQKWPKFLTKTYPLSGIKKKTQMAKMAKQPRKRPTFAVGIEHP